MGKGFYLCFNGEKATLDKVASSGTLILCNNPSTKIDYTKLHTYYRYDYEFFKNMYQPIGAFEVIENSYINGIYYINLSDSKFYQYDKIKLVGIKEGSFSISDIQCDYSGGISKVNNSTTICERQQGEELEVKRGFSEDWNTTDGWKDGGNLRISMPTDVRSYPPSLKTNSHIKLDIDSNGFPKEISKTYEYNTKNNVAYKRIIIRSIIRLFPKIYNPSKTGEYYAKTPQITDKSFDYSNLCIELKTSGAGSHSAIKKCLVDIDWCIAEAEFILPPFIDNFTIALSRDTESLVGHEGDNFEMQLADVSVQIL